VLAGIDCWIAGPQDSFTSQATGGSRDTLPKSIVCKDKSVGRLGCRPDQGHAIEDEAAKPTARRTAAVRLLSEHRHELDLLAEALLEHETLDEDQIVEVTGLRRQILPLEAQGIASA
jgi:hypothetical protein